MKFELQLRQTNAAAPAPAAWFLPGISMEGWFAELARCGLAAADTRLFVIPRSIHDRTPAGLLVIPAHPASATARPTGMPFQQIAGRMFIPADAELHPPVTESELRALCPYAVSFFHPAFGLSSFEEKSDLRVWTLIEPPEERAADWNSARAGVAPLPPLHGIILAQPPSIADLFGGAENEIGSDPIVDLPPAPDEPKDDPLRKGGRNLKQLFAKGVAGAIERIPHNAADRTWLNNVEDWARRQLKGVEDQLERIRNKELHRLMEMLEKDPEAGLRHAIPMNNFAHRGLGAPGAHLGSHSLNFNPNKLGGGAADIWHVSPDIQENLRRRYRELADREMRLGRHRRAAYIYAQLLGDLISAANALKQGRHFREAAVLYDEHIKNPLEAARCLAEGGLLEEAIERFTKLGRWLDVADLQERLGNRAAADEAFRNLVNERIAIDDRLGAAKLLDERLRAPEEALDILVEAWPSSHQAIACLSGAFKMMARLGRHVAAINLMTRLAQSPPPRLVLPLLNALSGPARDYPHEGVKHRAADLSRVIIGRQLTLANLPVDEARLLAQFLTHLAPHDLLLARDVNRHLATRRETEVRALRNTFLLPPPSTINPVLVRRFELPRQIEWLRLRSEWHWFYAVGVTAQRLTLIRGAWQGEMQSLSWLCMAEAAKYSLILEPSGERGSAIAVGAMTAPLEQKRFPATDLFFGQECLAGTPPWLNSEHWPVAFGYETIWTAHLNNGRAILSCHDRSFNLQRTIDITEALFEGAEHTENTRACLTVVQNTAAIAFGNRLVLTNATGPLVRLELPANAINIIPTLPITRLGVAVILEHGAAMHWFGSTELIELERDLLAPHAAFIPGGPLVLVSNSRMILLELDSTGVKKVTRVELPGQRPVGVCATANAGEFAILGARGEITVYKLPG